MSESDVQTAAEWFRLSSHLRAEVQRALGKYTETKSELGILKAVVREAQQRCEVEACGCTCHGIRI